MTKRDQYLRRKYGITDRTYKAMLTEQEGVCFICERKPKKGKRLHVDHDHKTGRVRGLLCWYCNHRFLGRRRENPTHHSKAVLYLTRHIDWRDHQV